MDESLLQKNWADILVAYVVIYFLQQVSNISQKSNLIENKHLQNLGLTVYNDVAEETCDSYVLVFLLCLSCTLIVLTDKVSLMTSWTCSPWSEAPYEDAAERTALGGLSLDGFLSEVWWQSKCIGLNSCIPRCSRSSIQVSSSHFYLLIYFDEMQKDCRNFQFIFGDGRKSAY